MTPDPSLFDDDAETLSTLEALNDIADSVETIVIGFGGEEERNAYLALAGEYDDYAGSLPEGAATKRSALGIQRATSLATRKPQSGSRVSAA